MTELMKPFEREVGKYTEDYYEDVLREMYGDVSICGCTYDAAYALKEIDPTAFHCGFVDFQEYETAYGCPICGDLYSDYDDAKLCCQAQYECPVCGEGYDSDEEARDCCPPEEDEDDD